MFPEWLKSIALWKITAQQKSQQEGCLSHITIQVGSGHNGGKVLGNTPHFCLQGCLRESEERTCCGGGGGGERWPITLCSWWMYWNKEKPRRLNCILLLLERTPKSYFLYKDYNNKSISLYYFICPLQAFLCTYQCTLLFWEQRVKISLTADIKVKDHKDAVRKTS